VNLERFYNEAFEKMSRRELLELRHRRLRWTVKHAYENNPFYRRKFDETGVRPEASRPRPTLLSSTSPQKMISLYPYGVLAVPREKVVEVHATSGTTGVLTLGFYTLNDIEVWGEVCARSLVMAGLTQNDVLQITPSFGMFTGGFGFFYGARKVKAMVVLTGAGFSKRQIQYMLDFDTTMVCAVVSYMLRLTETAWEMGVDPAKDTKVRKGILGSEMWAKEMKKRISEAWDMDVYDIYGFTELCGPGVATDCHIHDGLHLWEDHFYVEVVDPKTAEALEPEERGELVFTTLTKEASPVIRYRSRDVSYLYDAVSCDCGRTHARIGLISGRTDDMIKISGVAVWPSAVENVLLKHPELGFEYQLVVSRSAGLDRMKVVAELTREMNQPEIDKLRKHLEEELRETLMTGVEVEFVPPMALQRQEVGKAKRVLDQRNS
jgi:phenylacetate-CoA ligase